MDYKAVKVELEEYGFSFLVIKLPSEDVNDKLVGVSPQTGLLCRTEYQDFLFSELIVNLERVFRFFIESSGGDVDEVLELRNKVEEAVYRINPLFNASSLIMNKNGIIKIIEDGVEGIPLVENKDWDRVGEAISPFFLVDLGVDDLEDADLIDEDPPQEEDSVESLPPPVTPNSQVVYKAWDLLAGVEIEIRKFTKDDLDSIFGGIPEFVDPVLYRMHVIRKCIVKHREVVALVEALEMEDDVPATAITEDLFRLCIEVNPFLSEGEVDLEELARIRKDKQKSAGTRPATRKNKKSKVKSDKTFSGLSREELITLPNRMASRIIGQSSAIDQITDAIQVASCGLRDAEKPVGAYLLCGQTGTGKTYLSKVLAEELCGSREHLIRIDCSEYTQQHDIQKLIGAPPSFVGHDDGGQLTNAVQARPFSVILFDEIEKAHSKLFDILLQIMDDARLTDGKGNTVSFNDCVILLTSNIGVKETEAVGKTMGFGDASTLTSEKKDKAIQDALKNKFRPEFLNRIDSVVNFENLSKKDTLQIINLMLSTLKGYLNNKSIEAKFTPAVSALIFTEGFSDVYGARPLQRAIDKFVIKPLAKKILRGEIPDGSSIVVDYKDGELSTSPAKKKAVV